MPPAGQRDEFVAAFMDQKLAVDALVALPRETPYPFTALATVRSLWMATVAISWPFPKPMSGWMKTQAPIQKIPHGEGPGTSFLNVDSVWLSSSLPGLTEGQKE